MAPNDRQRWDRKHAARRDSKPGAPAGWLGQRLDRLPRPTRALDLAAGDGRHSLLLADRGWNVTAVDISPVGLDIGRRAAESTTIDWVVDDLDVYRPDPGAYGLVLCFFFLDRRLLPELVAAALRSGGIFVAETFNRREADRPDARITNPDYLLADDEWLALFPDFEVLEHDQRGPTSRFLARRP